MALPPPLPFSSVLCPAPRLEEFPLEPGLANPRATSEERGGGAWAAGRAWCHT